jgi:hypothetical protein
VGVSAGHRRVTGAVALVATLGLVGVACVAGAPGGGVARPIAAPCASGSGPGGGGPPPTSPTTVPETPATTMWGTPSRPDLSPIVAVGTDGAVVTLDATTGDRIDDLAPAPSAGAVVGVTLSADRATAWFDTCQRGGPGTIYQVPVDGAAAPRRVATGSYPEASPTGAQLAYLAGRSVVVRDLATGTERRWTDTTGRGRLSWLAWVGDGTELVWVSGGQQLVRLDTDAAGAQPQAVPGAVAGTGEVLYAPLGARYDRFATVMVGTGVADTAPHGLIVSIDGTVTRSTNPTDAGIRDRAAEPSGHWSLWADAYANLRWAVGGGTGLIAAGYTAADW